MCRVLCVSTSGYYGWKKRKTDKTKTSSEQRHDHLEDVVESAFYDVGGVSGYRPVYEALVQQGVECGSESVRIAMKTRGLRPNHKKRFVPRTTDSDHNHPIAENLLNRCFDAARPNMKWVSDITYIPLCRPVAVSVCDYRPVLTKSRRLVDRRQYADRAFT